MLMLVLLWAASVAIRAAWHVLALPVADWPAAVVALAAPAG